MAGISGGYGTYAYGDPGYSEAPVLNTDLVVQNSTQITASDNVVLKQNVLAQNAVNSLSSSNVILVPNLNVGDGHHALFSDDAALIQHHYLTVQDSLNSLLSDVVVLGVEYNLIVSDAVSGVFSPNLIFSDGKPNVYVGTSWIKKPIKVYRSGSWDTVRLFRWNGIHWELT